MKQSEKILKEIKPTLLSESKTKIKEELHALTIQLNSLKWYNVFAKKRLKNKTSKLSDLLAKFDNNEVELMFGIFTGKDFYNDIIISI